jgi:hypothetical protein
MAEAPQLKRQRRPDTLFADEREVPYLEGELDPLSEATQLDILQRRFANQVWLGDIAGVLGWAWVWAREGA